MKSRRVPRQGIDPASARAWVVLGSALALSLLLAPSMVAQPAERPLRFGHLSVEDGLSDSWVRSTIKDHRGFLWLATRSGVSRYDGYSFRRYHGAAQATDGSVAWDTSVLFEDSQQRLWVGADGLHLYDRDRDRFERVWPSSQEGIPRVPAVRALCEDQPGNLWIGTTDGLYRFDPATRAATVLPHDRDAEAGPGSTMIMALACNPAGHVWVGETTGLRRLDPNTGTIENPFANSRQPVDLEDVVAATLYEHPDGTLWLGTVGQGLFHIDPRSDTVDQYLPDPRDPASIGEARIMSLAGDGGSTIYAGGEYGLHILDTRTGRFHHCVPDADEPTSISSSSIWSLYLDDQAILWVGTFNGGVSFLSAQGQRFGVIRGGRTGLGDSHVLAVLEDSQGALWIGTDGGGLDKLDRRSGKFQRFRKDLVGDGGLASNSVMALAEDREHRIWIGTWAGGLQSFDPRSRTFTHFTMAGMPGPENALAVMEDSRGDILVGTLRAGLLVVDHENGVLRSLRDKYAGLHLDPINVIAEDSQGDLWVGLGEPGVGGVDRVSRSTGRVTALRHDPADTATITHGGVVAIHPDSRGNVWLGTDSGGLDVIEAESGRVRHFTTADGLPSNTIAHILEDDAEGLWISTSRGLVWFEHGVRLPSPPRFTVFDHRDGLQGIEFRRGAGFKGRGELFFGGQRGLSFFRPHSIERNPEPPPVVLTDLRVFNQPVAIGTPGSPLSRSITETDGLHLSYRHSVVTFEFSALNFISPERNRYTYKLEGFESRWSPAGTQRTATYTNLPPGDFTLRVRASNNDGVWNPNGISLPIHVAPPFWRTWWFYGAVAVLLAAFGAAAYRLRVRHHVLLARELQEKVAEATAQIKTLHGLLPICSWCKKVRDDGGYWSQIEEYVSQRTQAEFSHGICPECRLRYFPQGVPQEAGERESPPPS